MRFAVLADLHLPDRDDTVKEKVFDCALEMISRSRADAVLCVGDMIMNNAVEAAKRVKNKIAALNIPVIYACGNTENAALQTVEMFSNENLFCINKTVCAVFPTEKNFSENEYAFTLEKVKASESAIIISHYLPRHFSEVDKSRLAYLLTANENVIFIAGHEHYDRIDGVYHVVRGIDPDKAIGGMPSAAFFEYDEEKRCFKRENAEIDLRTADDEKLQEFVSFCGISGMHETLKNFEYAILNKIASFEMRHTAVADLPFAGLAEVIEKWRKVGGRHLSMHMPDIVRNSETAEIDLKSAEDVAELAVKLGCDRLTVHVPKCSVETLSNADCRQKMLDAYALICSKVLRHDISVGIENMHMTSKDTPDEKRRFGYTPQECREWIEDLRRICRSDKIGFHFDIGHARNNAPFSAQYAVSTWFAELGKYINGYHLHQVKVGENGKFLNHQAITEPFGALISYASFYLAWQTEQIAHAPIFIETSLNADVSYDILKNNFLNGNCHE